METILIIDRFEGEKAVLKTEDGSETIILPRRFLPETPEVKEGAAINFDLKLLKKAGEEKRKKAKDILNEILNLDEKNPDS